VRNPFFGKRNVPVPDPAFPIYLVTRLSGGNLPEVQAMIDRALAAPNRGKFGMDLKGPDTNAGNNWLLPAAMLLPADRVVLETTARVLYGIRDGIR
jgi:uncharacterized protein (TIGR03790 family)